MKNLHRDRVVRWSNLRIALLAVFALSTSVFAGYLLSELANQAFPVCCIEQKAEPSINTLNRLIF